MIQGLGFRFRFRFIKTITSQPRVELRNLHYINYYYVTNFKIIVNYLHLKRFAHRRYKGSHSPISLKMFSIKKAFVTKVKLGLVSGWK